MKLLPALLLCILLGMSITACGSSRAPATQRPSTAANGAQGGGGSPGRPKDRDNDEDNNDDDQHVLGFGLRAGAADTKEITNIVKRYYVAAAAADGTKGCALLTPFITEAVAEEYGHSPGLRGTTCATVLSKLFAKDHSELVGKSAALKLMRIGIEGDKSLVAVEFPEIPTVHQVALRRNGGKWTMLSLLDGIIE